MAVLRAYFDNSGDDQDAEQRCISVGGYLGAKDTWERFEDSWGNVLKKFGVGYLHMKEFRKPNGIYFSFSLEDKREFFSDLIGVIDSLDLAAFELLLVQRCVQAVLAQ